MNGRVNVLASKEGRRRGGKASRVETIYSERGGGGKEEEHDKAKRSVGNPVQ